MKLVHVTGAVICMLLFQFAHASEQGEQGSASTARFTISLSLSPSLSIDTDTDIGINIVDRTVDARYRQAFCVSGQGNTRFTVTPYGDTDANGSFVLRNRDNEALPFSVTFMGEPGGNVADRLQAGVPSDTWRILPGGRDCDERTWFEVTFEAEDLEYVTSGLYSGSLTFLVSPV